MKQHKIKWNITIPIVLAVVLVLVITATLALFTTTQSGTRTFTLSNFTSGVEVYFDNNGTQTTAAAAGTAGGGTYYTVSLDSADANFLGNLHINAQYNGAGVGLIRVQISEEWSKTDTSTNVRTVYPYQLSLPYMIASPYGTSDMGNQSKWYDNRATDHCFYYATPVHKTAGNNAKTIPLVAGVSTADIDFGAIAADELRILVKVDVVQVNRYPQYWGMHSLPWNGASSLGADLALAD